MKLNAVKSMLIVSIVIILFYILGLFIPIIKNTKEIKKFKKGSREYEKNIKEEKFSYIIKIADFYYEKTAKMMQERIKNELNLSNSKIIKISNTNFRVYLGPFNNLKSLKNAFDDINPLNFENIEIIKL